MSASNKKVLVLGTNPYAGVLIDMFEICEGIEFVGLVENQDRARCSERIAGLPVHWSGDIDTLAGTHALTCCIATTLRQAWLEEKTRAGFEFVTLVHPSSIVSRQTMLGAGVIIDAACVLAGFSNLADHVRIGRRATVGHHTKIGACSTIHPGAIISGNCTLGSQVIVGSGAIVIDGMSIGTGAVVSAGSVVTRNIPDRALVTGNPARVVREKHGPI